MDIHELLSKELPTDNAVELMDLISKCEAYGDTIARKVQGLEHNLATEEARFDIQWAETMAQHEKAKVAIAEAEAKSATADIKKKMSELTADIKYYKKMNTIIENRCSVGQSFLSNISAMIKASIGIGNPR